MRRSITTSVMLSALLLGTAVWADDSGNYGGSAGTSGADTSANVSPDQSQAQGQDQGANANANANVNQGQDQSFADTSGTSVTAAPEVTRGYLSNEVVGVKPQVGAMTFRDPFTDSTTARAVYGLTVEMNAMPLISPDLRNIFFGPETGAVVAHLGDPSSNFWGTNSNAAVGNAGTNFLQIPANLKLGYAITDNLRIAAHGGGNVTYRSNSNAMFLGDSSAEGSNVWRLFPNAGGDLDLGLGKNVAISVRPDWTFTPGDNYFVGTVALSIPIG